MANASLNDKQAQFKAAAAQPFVPQGDYLSYQQAYGGQYNQYGGQGQPKGQYGYQGGYQNNQYGNQYSNQYNNQYNKQYNSQYGNQYSQYNAQQPQTQAQGMSLAYYQKQQAAALASLNKPKKTLKLAPSSGIKLATKASSKTALKEPTPASESCAASGSTSASAIDKAKAETPATSASPATSAEPSKAESKTEVKSETKAAPAVAVAKAVGKAKAPSSGKTTPTTNDSTPAASADIVAREQEEEVDEDVVRDMYNGKDHISIIFMGHVDAGKSTMSGNILYLTGAVDKRTVEKYEREAKDAGRQGWYLSWVMDTNKEERNDGKTIEVGKACFETEKRRYTILDAPGHKMYVSEMIGGASQADVGILVISARKGEYETGFEKGGQTREHALLAKTQGVNKIVVVVNKMDDTTVNWSEERYKDCITKLGAFLKGVGYSKDDVVFMPVSGYSGAGLKDRVSPEDCPWYTGSSLLEYLDSMETMNRRMNAPFMMPISGKMKDMGTIVEGKVESGHLKKYATVLMMPNRTPVEVVAIYNETEQECDAAFSGEQIRLKIKGVEEEDIQQGYVLTSPKNPVKTVTRFEAQIAIVELKSILSTGFSCVMHLHTAIEEVTFVELKHKLEKGTNRKSKKPPAFAKKGMKIIAVLEVNELVCAETYNDYQQLGRFTLRDQGTTIAIGKITKLL
ncbi:hypothetical protein METBISCDRAFT_17188 [Metschnikowia bicuspidata]|uniref:Eukaryotic peptide chain release factor GTP-binding subunit n=1 Tax=Metschnikowia bicuspidata TaxID=27322 RepID=A0A4P9ZB53_9ASCO|nr:hypothetical protein METBISCDRAFT_17188 [Metschnikowia bicuspidata]